MVENGIELVYNFDDRYDIIKKYLNKFHCKKVDSYVRWEWNHMAASVGLTESELLTTINKKLLTDYREANFDELWLVIVIGYRLSQAIGYRNLIEKINTFSQMNKLLMKSNFDKIFIYHYMIDKIYVFPGWYYLNSI